MAAAIIAAIAVAVIAAIAADVRMAGCRNRFIKENF